MPFFGKTGTIGYVIDFWRYSHLFTVQREIDIKIVLISIFNFLNYFALVYTYAIPQKWKRHVTVKMVRTDDSF